MKRKTRVLLISYLCAAFLAVLGAAAAYRASARQSAMRLDENSLHAFGEVLTAVEMLDTSLQKSAYAVSPGMISAICTQVCSSARTAEMALSVLPAEHPALEKLAHHIALVGDYADSLSRAAAGGEPLSPEALGYLRRFSEATSSLRFALGALQQALAEGAVTAEAPRRALDALDNLNAETGTAADTMQAELEALTAALPEVPVFAYDGQYTEETGTEPAALAGCAAVTEEEARGIAARFLRCAPEELKPNGRTAGRIPTWGFLRTEEKRETGIAVTEQGGAVLRFYTGCTGEEPALSHAEAVAAAAEFLEGIGYSDMKPVTYTADGSTENLAFVYVQDRVLCSPDCIRVKVCLATGEILGMEATDYLQYHRERELPEVRPEDTPQGAVPPQLEILQTQAVLLQSAGKRELLCTEYFCRDAEGAECLIYVNAETGVQERILLVREDSGGVRWI